MIKINRKTLNVFIRNKTAFIGACIILFFIIVAVFAPFLAPHNPMQGKLSNGLLSPSLKFPLGTDGNGRCILSRVIYGSRISLLVGIVAVGFAIITGIIFGLLSGYYGCWVDNLIMRLMDIILALPSILLAMVVSIALGSPSLFKTMIAVSIVSIPAYTRVLRASVLTIKEREYVLAAKAMGVSNNRIMFKTILPNCIAPLIVQMTLGMGTAILEAAGLSFLGLGAQPPTPEWGAMLNENFKAGAMLSAPWAVTAPGIPILLVVLGFNLLGDGLRDIMDPKIVTKNKKN